MKRTIDVTAAAGLLVLTAPMLALVAVLVWIRMGRPVLYCQERAGWRGRPFTLWKFRTMRPLVGADGRLLSDAERLTPLGRLLRRTSIDELPQLVNVLRGEMSLVGPRPLLMDYLDRYTPVQARRHDVKPGITGWAQVNGRNALPWEEKLALDVWYVDHWNLRLDMRVFWLTVWSVCGRRGIDHGADSPMPEFMGTAAGRATACQDGTCA